MAAAICITEIITHSSDSGISMDEIILLVIVLTTVTVPHGSVGQKLPMRVSEVYLNCITTL